MTDQLHEDPAATPPPPSAPTPSARELLRQPAYLTFLASRAAVTLAASIQGVTLGWQVYDLARRDHDVPTAALYVGLLGLCAFLPVLALTLPAGATADRHDRRRILLICYAGEIATVALLTAAAASGFASIPLLLAVAAVFGGLRTYFGPASTAMGPMLVRRALLPRAIAWNSLVWQLSTIVGPLLAGLLIAVDPAWAYAGALALYAVGALLVFLIRAPTRPEPTTGSRTQLVREGLAYVWRNKIVFGAISLDLFAVLLGGATALLPVFARDVLQVGPEGFGLLRAGPSMGAAAVAVVLAVQPIRRHAGLIMFTGVALFGLATVCFALSRVLWVSVAFLAVLGAADMVSVYVRQTLVQIVTPDAMRGRVGAVSLLFIGASNELGEFESGVAARLLGPVGAALFGGIGAVIVTGVWARLFPELRRADRLT